MPPVMTGIVALLLAQPMQTGAATRDNHIHVLVQPQQFTHILAVRVGDILCCARRNAYLCQRIWITSTSAMLLRRVSLPPRRMTALPVFSASVAMSMVTLGRAS